MIEKPIVSGLLIFLIITVIWCLYKHQLFFNDQKQTQKSDKSESKDDEHSHISGLSFALSGRSQGPSNCPDEGINGQKYPFKEIDCTDIKDPKCVYFMKNTRSRRLRKGRKMPEKRDPVDKNRAIEHCFYDNYPNKPITGPTRCPDTDADGNKFNYPFKEFVCDGEFPFRPKCRYYSLETTDAKEEPITINDLQTAKTLISDCFKQQTIITNNNAECENILRKEVDHIFEGYWCDNTQNCDNEPNQRVSLNYTLTNVAGSDMKFVIGNNGHHDGYCRNNDLLLVPDGNTNNWYSLLENEYLQTDVGSASKAFAGSIYYLEAGRWMVKNETGFFYE